MITACGQQLCFFTIVGLIVGSENTIFLVFLDITYRDRTKNTNMIFLSDPGIPGVRSKGPDVTE